VTTSAPPAAAPREPGRGTGRLVGGIVLLVIGLIALAIGGTLVGLHLGLRDDDGFYEIDENALRTPTRALVSESVEVDVDGAWLLDESDLGEIRIQARAATSAPVFVGIGPTADVRRYLAGVDQQETDFDDGDAGAVTSGGRVPAPPASQSFWVASAEGPDRQEVVWSIEDGEWSGVIMRPDAARGVDVTAQLGVRTDLGLWVGIGLLAFGLVLGGVGVALLVSRRRRAPPPPPPTASPPPPPPPPPAEPRRPHASPY
jgi:hypothetical protein